MPGTLSSTPRKSFLPTTLAAARSDFSQARAGQASRQARQLPQLLSVTGMRVGEAIGLDPKFAYNVIKKVGNYGEIFERNLGKSTKIGFERGLNKPWTQGGLIYSPPFR